MTDRTFPSRAALVTGCSTGIGRATALALHAAGHPVFATARRPETLAALAGRGLATLALDVTDEASMRAAVEAVERAHGAVGVLVNNAGYAVTGPVEQTPMAVVRRQFETNVFGLVRLSQLVLPGMRAQGWGRVVNMSSMGGRIVFPGGGAYHATKHAVEAFSDALRYEVAPFGVRVIVVEPGPVLSSFGDTAVQSGTAEGPTGGDPDAYADFNREVDERYRKAYDGSGRASRPEDVARVVARAVASERPRSRYLVGPVARTLVSLRRFGPAVAYDRVMTSAFPPPAGPGRG